MFAVEPEGGWKVGDKAYCLNSTGVEPRTLVERGRVYDVVEVKRIRGMGHNGLKLRGVDTGEVWGFWSNRFVCLRGRTRHLQELQDRSRPDWYGAYKASEATRLTTPAQGMEIDDG